MLIKMIFKGWKLLSIFAIYWAFIITASPWRDYSKQCWWRGPWSDWIHQTLQVSGVNKVATKSSTTKVNDGHFFKLMWCHQCVHKSWHSDYMRNMTLQCNWTLNGGTQKRESNVVVLAVTTWQGGIKNTKSPNCRNFISDSYDKWPLLWPFTRIWIAVHRSITFHHGNIKNMQESRHYIMLKQ